MFPGNISGNGSGEMIVAQFSDKNKVLHRFG
jgi:hypothetical protein